MAKGVTKATVLFLMHMRYFLRRFFLKWILNRGDE